MILTRCPACTTAFRVRPEQLRARQGRVRCGHCGLPFNALESLIDEPAGAEPAVQPLPAPPSASAVEPSAALEHAAGSPVDADSNGTAAGPFFMLEEASAPGAEQFELPSMEEGIPELYFEVRSHRNKGIDFSVARSAGEAGPPAEPEALAEHEATAESGGDADLAFAMDPVPAEVPVTIVEPLLESAVAPFGDSLAEPLLDPESARDALIAAPTAPGDSAAPEFVLDLDDPGSDLKNPLDFPPEPAMDAAAAAATFEAIEREEPETQPALSLAEVQAEATPGIAAQPPATNVSVPVDAEPDALVAAAATTEISADSSSEEIYPFRVAKPGTGRKAWWGIGIGTLAMLLLAQSALVFREAIVQIVPETQAGYIALCAKLGCAMPLPREAGFIAIETSDLHPEPAIPDTFLLRTVIQNRAAFTQAYPHIELTLTDGQDGDIARRVLPPEEWRPKELPASGFAPRSSIDLALPFTAPGLKAVGYRVYAFYP